MKANEWNPFDKNLLQRPSIESCLDQFGPFDAWMICSLKLSLVLETGNMSLFHKSLSSWISGRDSFKGGGLEHPRCWPPIKQWVWAQTWHIKWWWRCQGPTYRNEPQPKLGYCTLALHIGPFQDICLGGVIGISSCVSHQYPSILGTSMS